MIKLVLICLHLLVFAKYSDYNIKKECDKYGKYNCSLRQD